MQLGTCPSCGAPFPKQESGNQGGECSACGWKRKSYTAGDIDSQNKWGGKSWGTASLILLALAFFIRPFFLVALVTSVIGLFVDDDRDRAWIALGVIILFVLWLLFW